MKVGMIGIGKLGLPCAVAMDMKGHDVLCNDIDPLSWNKYPRPYKETGPDGVEEFNPYLEKSALKFGNFKALADHSEIIFVAVQTPHDEKFEGITRIPNERVDFDYTWLMAAISNLSEYIKKQTVVAIMSTVLPGTMRREVMPLLNDNMKLVYVPQFIAMGTTMQDFINTEFWLFGVNDEWAAEKGIEFFKTISNAPIVKCTIEEAEAIKVLYNTAISTKIALANTWMEMAHKLPNVNVDVITDTLALATRRVNSFAYMRGGAGDGGG